MAIASRVGLEDVQVGFDGQPTWSDKPDVEAAAEARALGATCGGVRVWSLYVPNGRFVGSPHYDYKLEWLAALRNTAHGWLAQDPSAQIALVGDWNIAPTDEDVWSLEFYRGQHTRHTSRSVRRSTRSSTPNSPMWCGLSRRGPPYTPTGTTRSCASRRTAACASTSSSARRRSPIASRTARSSARSVKGKAPSDHAPVLVELA